jgi:hypothetical protein
MLEGFHANTSRFDLRKSTSAFLFRTERRPNTERTTIIGDARILDVLADSKEQAAHFDDWAFLGPRMEARRGASQTGLVPPQIGSTQHRI